MALPPKGTISTAPGLKKDTHMRLIESKALLPTRRDIAVRLFRQRTVFLICFLLVVAGFLLTGQFTPMFKAEMKILIRKERVDPVVTAGQNSTPELQSMNVSEEDLNSEVELLKGDDLLRDVVMQAGLVPAGSNDPIAIAKALRKLQKKLDVAAIPKTELIAISYESTDPEQSLKVLKTLESLYPAKRRNMQGNDFQLTFFGQQVEIQRTALVAAQAKLLDFTKATGVVSAGLQRDLTLQQLEALNQERRQTSAEMANLQGRTQKLAAQLEVQKPRIVTESKTADNPQLLQQLKATLLTLELKRTELLNKYDPHYRLVEDVDNEIATTHRLIDEQAKAPVKETSENINPIHQTLETEYEQSTAQLSGLRDKQAQLSLSFAGLERSAEDLAAKDSEQQVLLLNAKTAQDRFQLYADKLEQARMTHSLDKNGILNVVVAEEPVSPALPRNSTLGSVGALLFTGFLLSFGCAFLADVFDPTIRDAAELTESLNVPILAEFGRDDYIQPRLP
jgi:polysaccharide biosynthesis transport protein